MSASRTNFEFVGSWEEIVRRSAELAGRRVRVTVLADEPKQPLKQLAREWADQAELLTAQPGPSSPQAADFDQIVQDKFRKQGLKL